MAVVAGEGGSSPGGGEAGVAGDLAGVEEAAAACGTSGGAGVWAPARCAAQGGDGRVRWRGVGDVEEGRRSLEKRLYYQVWLGLRGA